MTTPLDTQVANALFGFLPSPFWSGAPDGKRRARRARRRQAQRRDKGAGAQDTAKMVRRLVGFWIFSMSWLVSMVLLAAG
jgi:hypothetical protein